MQLRGTFFELERRGIRDEWVPLFFTLERMIDANEDCRAAVAYRAVAEKFKIPERRVREGLAAFIKAGLFIAEKRSRQYTMIRRGVSRNVSRNVAEEIAKNSIESIKCVSRNVAQNVATGVSGSSAVSSAFDVSDSGVSIDNKGSLSARTPTPPSPIDKFKNDYNRLCARLIQCRELNDKRRKKIRAELASHPDDKYWAEVFSVANRSAFMSGDNDRHWRANIDFILRCHIEIIEGKYSRPGSARPEPPRELPAKREEETYHEPTDQELAEWHRENVRRRGRTACRDKACAICQTVNELEELPV